MQCKVCSETDPAKFYPRNKSRCKSCVRAAQAEWNANNPARVRANASKSASLQKGAVLPDDFDLDATIALFEEAIRLTEHTGEPYEVDHIIPCADGGLHCASNMQVITRRENQMKDAYR